MDLPSEDRGFKALCASYPVEAVEVCAPALIAAHGPPIRVTVLHQECPPPALEHPSAILDIALQATWADGMTSIIVLVEHYSEIRRIALRTIAWYSIDLARRHEEADVYPVVFVTDRRQAPIPDRWTMAPGGVVVLDFRVSILRITGDDADRLRSWRNRVAAVLLALAINDAVEATLAAMRAMIETPGPYRDPERFLPFIMKLAKMRPSDLSRFHHSVQETGMVNILTELREKAEAEGWASGMKKGMAEGKEKGMAEGKEKGMAEGMEKGMEKGKAQGEIDAIRRLVHRGRLSIDDAKTELRCLHLDGVIDAAHLEAALTQLG